jgi:hypothetical protein
MYIWADERSIPEWLTELLKVSSLPKDLKKELEQARKEIDENGAVSYPTKSRVEYCLHKYYGQLSSLLRD